eukprot:3169641-Pleurochrysis_carterae.AAC.1
MYTDDVVFAAVGTDRIVVLLRAWHKVTSSVGLTMAIPEKRQAGSAVLWLGVIFVAAAGVLFLPCDKGGRQDPAHALAQYGHSGVAQIVWAARARSL